MSCVIYARRLREMIVSGAVINSELPTAIVMLMAATFSTIFQLMLNHLDAPKPNPRVCKASVEFAATKPRSQTQY